MDRLTLERTQPVQGQRVYVDVLWNDKEVGELDLDFKGWLKFKKLLEKGIEMDAKEEHALDVKLVVKGREAVEADNVYPLEVTLTQGKDVEDEEDLAAIAAAEAGSLPQTNSVLENVEQGVTQGLIRSLRREET